MSDERIPLFGTDGMRGVFGLYPLDRPTVARLGTLLGRRLGRTRSEPEVVLGGDTRASREALCRWLAAGLAAEGTAIDYAGVIPTPGISALVRDRGAVAGISVSASHNPYPDNGIKLLDEYGFKWGRDAEDELERELAATIGAPTPELADLAEDPRLGERYLALLEATIPGRRPLAGLRLVVDCANGAASPYASRLFAELGAEVLAIGSSPDGENINRGVGSTHPESLAQAVRAHAADLGVAFDGDADRAILVDRRGEIRDGDAILYLWATALVRRDGLVPPRIVATTMSNLGLERALARHGIGVVRCGVGDRVVVETMRRQGIVLGGEQSGHIVHLGLSTTGDGLLTALQVLAICRREDRDLTDLLAGFERFPQVLRNVPVRRKPDLAGLPALTRTSRSVEERLGADGRLVVRYSGTEPLVRVMIEGPDQVAIEALAEELAEVLASELA